MFHFLKSLLILLFISSHSFADQLIIEPDAGRTPLLNAIQQATSSIDLVMYGFTDEAFTKALITAKNKGKNVHILLEPSPYKAENENSLVIRQLQAKNINLEWPDKTFKLTHQKTFIFDNKTAIVMTFNLTHGSFTHERNFALILTDPNEVREIKQVFDADVTHKNITVTDSHLLWSPNNSREKMLQFIQSAHSKIQIYAQDLTDYKMIGALANAARTGIKVQVLLSVSPEKFQSRKFSFLKKAGVIIHNSKNYYIHAKVIIVDNKRAVLGSINFTKPSLDDNRELSVMTEDHETLDQLSHAFSHDWQDTKTSSHTKNSSWPTTRVLRQFNRFYYHARHTFKTI